jgi:transcriptional regulator with XRE-family HTH domain
MSGSARKSFLEGMCDRFLLAQEATGLSKFAFAKRVGLTPSQLTNIKNHRNAPAHAAIHAAMREFGFTADWFYSGSRVGFRDQSLADRLRAIEGQLG